MAKTKPHPLHIVLERVISFQSLCIVRFEFTNAFQQ